LGKKKKDLSATMADDKGALCDLDPKNIIYITDGDVPDLHDSDEGLEEKMERICPNTERDRLGFDEVLF
jgi:hypothetical protein